MTGFVVHRAMHIFLAVFLSYGPEHPSFNRTFHFSLLGPRFKDLPQAEDDSQSNISENILTWMNLDFSPVFIFEA